LIGAEPYTSILHLILKGGGVMYRVLVFAIAWSVLSPAVFADTQDLTKSFAASPGDTLVVLNDFGRVRIRTTDSGDVQMRIQMVSAGKFSPEFQVASQKSGREIYIYAFFSGQSQETVNLEIQVPRFINAVIWGANPEVDLQGVAGTVRVQTISGTVTLEDATSSVVVVSDRGDIVYRANVQPQGDIRLESTSGNVNCRIASTLNVRGWLRAGGSVVWDKEPEIRATSIEKQLGSFGPLLNGISLSGNVRIEVGSAGAPAKTANSTFDGVKAAISPKPAATETRTVPPPPAPPSPAAQPVTMQDGKAVSIKVAVDSVLLNVSVRDRLSNRSIAGLGKNDFQVYEDGVPQEVQQVQTTDAPFSLLLLMDVSGSTESFIKLMKQAATDFTQQINQNDKIAIASFNSNVQLLQDFTNDRQAAVRAINRLRSGGGTAFYDALMTCLDQYMRHVEGRKAIVVFTDGVDNQLSGDRGQGSTTTYTQLYRRIQEVDTMVYTIFLDSEGRVPMTQSRSPWPGGGGGRRGGFGFPFPIPMPIPTPGPTGRPYPVPGNEQAAYETAREQLETIAEQTGGRMYSPKRAQDLAGTYSEIADDLRIQYLVNYASSNPERDNRWRAIRVEVRDHPEAVARTRKGYYATRA
jgi:Ca-activated chloride channel homolog